MKSTELDKKLNDGDFKEWLLVDKEELTDSESKEMLDMWVTGVNQRMMEGNIQKFDTFILNLLELAFNAGYVAGGSDAAAGR